MQMEQCTSLLGSPALPAPAPPRARQNPRRNAVPLTLCAENDPVVARLLGTTRRQWGLELDLLKQIPRKGRRVVLYV